MIGYIVDVEFVWGYQCKLASFTRGSSPYLYPPPTTFLGALAESIARHRKIPERKGLEIIDKLSSITLAIGLRPLNCFPMKINDLSRIISFKLTSGKKYPRPDENSFDASAMGRTILSTYDEEAPKIRWFIVFSTNEIDDIKITEEDFWRIHRIGSKESRVSVINMKKVKPEISDKPLTNYSFPLLKGVNIKEVIEERWETECYIRPYKVKIYENDIMALKSIFNIKTPRKSSIEFTSKMCVFKVPILSSPFNPPEIKLDLNDWTIYRYEEEYVVGVEL